VLNGCGLLIVNGPYTLEDDLGAVLPELCRRLAQAPGATHRLRGLEEALSEPAKTGLAGKRRMRITP
jgi:23S rRNA A2030 N6-methylase RlmJ